VRSVQVVPLVRGQLLGVVGVARRALEDEVFEQVRHAALAVVLGGRADEVGDVDGDGLLGLVGEHQDAQPVLQAVLGDALDRGDAFDARGERGGGGSLRGGRLRGGRGGRREDERAREEKREGEAERLRARRRREMGLHLFPSD
jgi:hypothetical protein